MQDDYYEYLDSHLALIGRRTHRIYQIGQPVTVRLLRVDKDQREVDFELVHPENAPTTKLRVPHKDRGGFGHGRGRNGNGRNGNGRNHGRPNDHRRPHGKHSHSRQGNGHRDHRNRNRDHDNFEIRHRDDETGRHNGSRNRRQINRDAAGGLHGPRRGFKQRERSH